MNSAAYTLRATITLTVTALCEALWGTTDGVNGGTYEGASDPLHQGPGIPRRRVPLDATVTVEDRGVVRLTDDSDGWIAERICGGAPILGRRDWQRLVDAGFATVGERA